MKLLIDVEIDVSELYPDLIALVKLDPAEAILLPA
jgi:hypothetical protein